MSIDFKQPMTAYEFIAILLSSLALLIPIVRWFFDRYIKKLEINFLPSGMITLYHNKSGSYLNLGGVYEAKNKSTTIREISAKVIRLSDSAVLPLIWSSFPSPVYRKIAGNIETSFETAHPFKVEAETLVPAFIEFANKAGNIDGTSNEILYPLLNASSPILSQPGLPIIEIDRRVKALPEFGEAKLNLCDLFFWKPGKYQLTITAVHTSGSFDKTYEFDLTDDESKFIKGNIDNLLVAHIAEQYKLFLPMRTITKAYKEKV